MTKSQTKRQLIEREAIKQTLADWNANNFERTRVNRYYRGGRTCAEYDALDPFTMAVVDFVRRAVSARVGH